MTRLEKLEECAAVLRVLVKAKYEGFVFSHEWEAAEQALAALDKEPQTKEHTPSNVLGVSPTIRTD